MSVLLDRESRRREVLDQLHWQRLAKIERTIRERQIAEERARRDVAEIGYQRTLRNIRRFNRGEMVDQRGLYPR